MMRSAAYLLVACLAAPGALAYTTIPPADQAALRFQQHMGAALPLDTPFQDSQGHAVRLADVFAGKPVVLILDYLHCKTLCGFVLHDTATALAHVPFTAGRDYQVVAISIDPRDGAAEARAAEAQYAADVAAPDASGWHFLTGSERSIRAVAGAVGFPFRYDAAVDQYAHPAGLTIATPQGTISRYVLGLGYRPLDLRLALSEAAQGTISSPASDLLLLCYCYDPGTGRYSLAIGNVTRGLCGATVVGLGFMVARLARARRT